MPIFCNKVPFSYFTGVREYDENGNWKRDYLNMDIPFEELALPRNDEERKLFNKRCDIETDNSELEDAFASLPFNKRNEDTMENFSENFDIPLKELEVIVNKTTWY